LRRPYRLCTTTPLSADCLIEALRAPRDRRAGRFTGQAISATADVVDQYRRAAGYVDRSSSATHQRAPHSLRSRLRLPEQGRVRDGPPLSPSRVRLLLNPTPLRKPPSSVAPSADARQSGLSLRETDLRETRYPRTSNHSALSPDSLHACRAEKWPLPARSAPLNWSRLRNPG
jgi:hypothetical protein